MTTGRQAGKGSRGLLLALLATLAAAGCASPRQHAAIAPQQAPAGIIEPGTTEKPRVMTAATDTAPMALEPAAAKSVYVAEAPSVAPAHGYAPDAAPRTATAAVEAAANGLARPATTVPMIGGVYPNINEAPGTSGVALMTPEERAAMEAQLRGLSSAHAAAATSGSAARRAEIEAALRDLAATHRKQAAASEGEAAATN